MTSGRGRPGSFDWRVPVALAALVAALYLPSLPAPFIWDDEDSVLLNPNIRNLAAPSAVVSDPATMAHPLNNRPVVSLSLALNYAAGGLDVRGYRAVNVALHLLTALLLYGVVCRTFERVEQISGRSGALAAVVSIAWAAHPLVSEAVIYITQRTELMVGFFYLLALYCAVRWFDSSNRGWTMAAIGASALGMGSKEVMVSLPIVTLVYDVVFVSGGLRPALRDNARLHLGLASTWVVLGALLLEGGSQGGAAGLDLKMGPWEYLRIQAGVIPRYLLLALWPSGLRISYHWPTPTALMEYAPGMVLLAALLAASVVLAFRRNGLGFAGLWLFASLAPSSSVLPIPVIVAAEKRMYLPLMAVVVVLVVGGDLLVQRARRRFGLPSPATVLVAAAIVIAALAATTLDRVHTWRSAATIWEDAVTKDPDDPVARNNLGQVYLQDRRLGEAEQQFVAALQVWPAYTEALHNLGTVHSLRGDHRAAAPLLRRALQQGERLETRVALAEVLGALGELDEAERHFRSAVRSDRRLGRAWLGLGNVSFARGDVQGSVRLYRRALRNDPSLAEAHRNLALGLLRLDRLVRAKRHASSAVALDAANRDVAEAVAEAWSSRPR